MRYEYAKLKLDKRSEIIIGSRWPLKKVQIFYEVGIIFFDKSGSFMIGEHVIIEIAEEFAHILNKVINNKLLLDESCYNIGLVQYKDHKLFWQYADVKNEDIKKDSYGRWIGYQYRLSGYRKKTAWLYNDRLGNIVFEVTPWLDVRKYRERSIHECWLKNYKPILKRIIKPEIAHAWLEQIRALLRTVRINSGLPPE